MDIPDLTPMNEAAARALFAEDAAQRAEGQANAGNFSPERAAKFMHDTRTTALNYWDAGNLDPSTSTYYRERALAVSLASWQALAESIWDSIAASTGGILRADNPYRKDA